MSLPGLRLGQEFGHWQGRAEKTNKAACRSDAIDVTGGAIDVQWALQITESYFDLHASEIQCQACWGCHFAIADALIAEGDHWLVRVFPCAGVMMGGVLVNLEVWFLLTRSTYGSLGAIQVKFTPRRDQGNGFSVHYAIGSLSRTMPH